MKIFCQQVSRGGGGLVVGFVTAVALGACSQSELAQASPAAQRSAAPAMRVIVKFRNPVPYQDAAFLQTLGQQCGVRLSYAASVGADTHVYLLQAVAHQGPDVVLRCMAHIPSVQYIEPDAVAEPS